MSTTNQNQTLSHPLLDVLRRSLNHVVTFVTQKWENIPLTLKPVASPAANASRQSFLLEGPEELSVEVSFSVFLLGDETYEIYVDVEDGPTHRLTHDPADDADAPARAPRLEREVTAVLLREIEPKIGQVPVPSPPEESSHVPRIRLTRDAEIKDANEKARRLLGHGPGEDLKPNFFSYVHGRNLRSVMRDLAHMVNRGMQRARWLLRLRTDTDRWRWYRAVARNRLSSEVSILLCLRLFGHSQRNP